MPSTSDRSAGRAPRNTLSRSRVVDAAIELIDTHGLAGLSMPRLAQHLGVGTMSLYRHVETKDDLLDAVAERLVGDVAVPDGAPGDWEARVVGYLRAVRAEALRHPALARLLADRGLTAGPVFDQLEAVHRILLAAGFSERHAVRAFYSLLTYVFGYLMWELPRVHQQPAAAYVAAWNESLDQLDRAAYPTLTALRRQLVTSASEEQFEYGLEQLAAALRTHLRDDRTPTADRGPLPT